MSYVDVFVSHKLAEEVLGLRVAARTKHPDEALRLCNGGFAELFEADRRLDVVAQDGLAGIDIAGQHRFDGFTQQALGKSRGRCHVLLHMLLERSRRCHRLFPYRRLTHSRAR